MSEQGFWLSDIRALVEGTVYTKTPPPDQLRVERAFASDLMSEVLTLLTDNLLLITGLNNVQAVRTAEMSDIGAILLVRDKKPTEKMVELAESREIMLLGTPFSMYRTAGVLYGAGLGYVF